MTRLAGLAYGGQSLAFRGRSIWASEPDLIGGPDRLALDGIGRRFSCVVEGRRYDLRPEEPAYVPAPLLALFARAGLSASEAADYIGHLPQV